MDLKKIEKLILLMKEHNLQEMEVEEKTLGRVRLMAQGISPGVAYMPPMAAMHSAPSAAPSASLPASGSAVPSDKQIRSPFVGTYYEAASPGSEAFVRPGQKVRKGDTLCIIEAMKIMNEIEAEKDCTIKEILIKNGQPLEFDQVIFTIE